MTYEPFHAEEQEPEPEQRISTKVSGTHNIAWSYFYHCCDVSVKTLLAVYYYLSFVPVQVQPNPQPSRNPHPH